MKRIAVLFSAMAFSGVAQANLCEGQAKALQERVQEGLSPGLTGEQLAQLRRISLDLCQSRSAAQGEAAAPPKGFDDWFSYFMLSKQPEKAGNKRLKRLKR